VSKKDQWMPLYVAEYLADTGHLTTTQHGAYLLLIMHYWRKRELPDDDKQLAAIAKLPLRIWLDCKETLQAFFHDGWRHHRIEQELSKRVAIADKRAAAGSKGGSTAQMNRAIAESQANASFCSSMKHKQRNITPTVSVERAKRSAEEGLRVSPELEAILAKAKP
jgi:uncharacterized protein YdaU (DUF1376 family)